jgi:hypothetical protein
LAITATRRRNQISHQCLHAIVSAIEPVVLDRHVLALDVPGFAEAFAERASTIRKGIGRSTIDEPDHR